MTVNCANSQDELIAACAEFDLVGFHGTSSLACGKIEAVGFLPDKVLSATEHDQILAIATSLNIDEFWYRQWLDMRSVTFAQDAQVAIDHTAGGHAGGQGLGSVQKTLRTILDRGDEGHREFARPFLERIELIRNAPSVVYAVDLSGLSGRLVRDKEKPIYHYYWHPQAPLPALSDIDPTRLIARLRLA
ncbi:MAG: hypothetical protein LBJ65_14990 [Burkholderia sp.]|jgi:hypothetical protein|uniref:hypothetical protein n=1 Tax=Burkholderia sp. TaxID=36773 RepID=UPI00281A0722|nr:hypothetical protein [Burkholderia sp.]MDR0242901.1 hypothetical protein [Burkholderia sp.]